MPSDPAKATSARQGSRITSIDALRGFVMFTMIFVNDLAGAPEKLVPDWMVHFSDRHKHGSGMTFVDLVFPGFLFIVGMSIPFALGSRISKGEPVWKTFGHVLVRTLALLGIGILMVHETPDSDVMGWSGSLWCTLMYLAAILAFCSISSPRAATPAADSGKKTDGLKIFNVCLRVAGMAALVWLAFAFRDRKGHGIISLSPLQLHTSWYGILGLIAWAYLMASIVYLIFRGRRTAILGCMVVLMCLFAADKKGAFDDFWLSHIVGIGEMLGSQAAITVGGLLLGSILVAADVTTLRARAKFTFWFAAGCAAAALCLQPLYGISKNSATPSWCLWSCAITAGLWFFFYLVCDVRPVKTISRPLALAGQNVLLTYLFSEMLPGLLDVLHLGDWYDSLSEASLLSAVARSALCGIVLLLLTVGLNRVGFRLKL
jgi:heparan-alpha-glucosaminide N-acetyltransferase